MTEQAFHEKYIKGINIKIILSTAGIIISGVWFGALGYAGIKQSIIDGNKDNRQFTKDEINSLRNEMNAKFDTVKFNQIEFQYNTKIQLEGVRARRATTFVTEKKRLNGSLAVIPYK